MKLYRIDVPIWATAYIKAESLEQAKQLARDQLYTTFIEVSGASVDGRRYDVLLEDNDALEVTLSPAMTVGTPAFNEPEEVEL